MNLQLRNAVDGEQGFSTSLTLTDSDLAMLRQLIRIQWLYRIQLLVPEKVKEFDQAGMENYHQVSQYIDHSTAWPKTARVLPKEAVSLIKKLDFYKTLVQEFGEFHVSDEEHLGWENIYWRLVRPGNEDLGSPHADQWFWQIGGYGKVAEFPHERIKIWMPIFAVPNKNGLMVSPGSHLKNDWKWHSEVRYGLNKPVLDESLENLNLQLLPLSPGQAVVFNDALIHGGAANLAATSRVSLEFTLLVPIHTTQKHHEKLSATV